MSSNLLKNVVYLNINPNRTRFRIVQAISGCGNRKIQVKALWIAKYEILSFFRDRAREKRPCGAAIAKFIGFSAAAGLKSGQSNLKRNFVLGYFQMTG